MSAKFPSHMTGLAGAVLLALAAPALAQTSWSEKISGQEASTAGEQQTHVDEIDREATQRSRAEAWGLTDKQWSRYQKLKERPRGTWSPDLDPITMLGLEARSEDERRHYAELLVEQQRKRVERELAFQKAYDAAWQRLYPEESRVNFFTLGRSQSAQSLLTSDTTGPVRYNVVVALEDCSRCESEVRRLLDQGALMDIWVVDSDGNDDAIRQWATKVGIPADRVRQGQITLNHGGQRFSEYEDALPRVMPRG
ncbi:TIGR03759 family integrating conjugative element protein [Halomonas elongata]|uniref:Secretion cluster MPF-G protein Tfc3 n=1 Tax=Halomonas elongata (strain ATCC 33173 / DSM 2581 / NBRC 15536 / NCIMB 2198 / 1H9) TaxID=768066 RepID=E1VA41_HALED|nr:TIGR03759 family integrating conjugative element protein [Halomonas elongata]WBF17670.1 TIGR03759 family integrating conjugative element protein [Halomonas elongata]WPU46511.1 TIGR03759 family integrating conjugative element protein [Halomonas elongata DSM 2581]CBV43929.1 secretion cluster MPF-G protein Tfc3 [Halomonas elongata DSM 2581]